MRPVGTLTQVTLEVDDVVTATNFWSGVTGLAPGQVQAEWAELEPASVTSGGPMLRLTYSERPKHAQQPNRGHLDVTVDDLDIAVSEIELLGGRVKKAPSIYPRPLSRYGEPVIEWAVTTDPSGNEFCLIRDLTQPEQDELRTASGRGPADDATWRSVAHRARYSKADPLLREAQDSRQCVGDLRCCVINVGDLAVALQFWSALMGVGPISSEWPFRFAYLGAEDERDGSWVHQLILQLSDDARIDEADRVHYDIQVKDLDAAVAQVVWMGGSVASRGPEEQLHSTHGGIDGKRMVMCDPSGNAFCLTASLEQF